MRAVRSVIYRMQMVINCARDRITDALNLGQLLHASVFDRFGAAKMPQQFTTALGANTWNIFQERLLARLGPLPAVAADRKAVCFVTNLLDQMQPWMIAAQPHLRTGVGVKKCFKPRLAGRAFCYTDHFDTGDVIGCQHLPCLAHLPFAAVDK
ncbi:MAG: hypothetical protein CM15mP84_04240 [Cellvibrionales bacterium]|nr:MAG: hypothetical protein CM15mP84_04240 [Cellvibrionales bacterium]